MEPELKEQKTNA